MFERKCVIICTLKHSGIFKNEYWPIFQQVHICFPGFLGSAFTPNSATAWGEKNIMRVMIIMVIMVIIMVVITLVVIMVIIIVIIHVLMVIFKKKKTAVKGLKRVNKNTTPKYFAVFM